VSPDEHEDVGPCQVVKMSAKALLIDTDSWRGWVPLACVDVEDLADVEVGEEIDRLRVATWYVNREGIE
jgi:hypothetical protein